jgi:hypothetical protein
MSDKVGAPSLERCIWECWENQDFMREYRRLSGHALGQDRRQGIERLIDQATGHEPPVIDDKEARQFFEFVRDVVWLPVLGEIASNLGVPSP